MFVIHTLPLWGDYGSLLISGMTGYLGRSNGQLQLLRTGPFVPPLCISGISDLLATPPMCDRLQSTSGVRGFTLVQKVKIVRLDWQTWDLSQSNPPSFPWEGHLWAEPESILTNGEDDTELNEAIGDILEVLLEEDGDITHRFSADGADEYRFRSPPHRNLDIFRARTPGGSGTVVCSSNFVERLPEDALRWLELVPMNS